jgi:hypothetical protein
MCLSCDDPTGNVSTSLMRGYDVVSDLCDHDDAHWPITPAHVAAIPPYHVADWLEKPEVWNGGGVLVGFDPLNSICFGEIAALSPRQQKLIPEWLRSGRALCLHSPLLSVLQ